MAQSRRPLRSDMWKREDLTMPSSLSRLEVGRLLDRNDRFVRAIVWLLAPASTSARNTFLSIDDRGEMIELG